MFGGEAVAVLTPRGTKALVKTRVEAQAPDILTMPISLERANRFIVDVIGDSGIYRYIWRESMTSEDRFIYQAATVCLTLITVLAVTSL